MNKETAVSEEQLIREAAEENAKNHFGFNFRLAVENFIAGANFAAGRRQDRQIAEDAIQADSVVYPDARCTDPACDCFKGWQRKNGLRSTEQFNPARPDDMYVIDCKYGTHPSPQSESKDAPTDEVKNGDYVIKLKGTHHEGFGIVREAFEGNDKVSVQVFDVFGEDGEPVTATYNRKSLTKLHLHPAPAVQLSDEQLRKNEDKLDKITDWKASFRAQQKRYNRYLSEKDAEIQRLKERENELGEKLRYYADCYAKKGRELSDAQHQLSQLKSTSSNP
jgi:hypothetical protein